MARDSKFWDRHAAGYAKSPIADMASYEEKVARTRAYLTPQSTVMEFGCGTGSTALLHAPFVKRVECWDISGGMLEIARQKAVAQGAGNIMFHRGTLDDVQAPEGGFDVIMGMSILHLLADTRRAIGQVFDMLKPGGVFVSSTVCIGNGLWIFSLIGPVGRALGLLPRIAVFRRDTLRRWFTEAGFEIAEEWRPDGRIKAVFFVVRKPG